MKIEGWTLEMDGELCPAWFRHERGILVEESFSLRATEMIAKIKIVPVYANITKRKTR